MFKYRKHIGLFFLAIFLVIKFAGIHEFMHSDNDEHTSDCEICEFVITSNATPFATSDTVTINEPVVENYKTISYYSYAYYYSKRYLDTSLFSRPPPMV